MPETEAMQGKTYWINNLQRAVVLKCLIFVFGMTTELSESEDYIVQQLIGKFDPSYFK